ncbi:MAG: hypothetical protein IPL33_12525 [Sphingobacteriales bacterium]|nr:hypothetical protein [Sphingobacteriales bacterium]
MISQEQISVCDSIISSYTKPGHEWWGNSVTSADIADMWIHEAFCTYGESMYVECMYGKKDAITYVNGSKKGIDNDRPIIGPYGVNKEGSGDMYGKGAVMLNTIRSIVDNDTLWFSIIKGLAEQFKHSTVTTEIIINYINQRSGKNLTPIFDQYLRYTNIPTLEYIAKKRGKIPSCAIAGSLMCPILPCPCA